MASMLTLAHRRLAVLEGALQKIEWRQRSSEAEPLRRVVSAADLTAFDFGTFPPPSFDWIPQRERPALHRSKSAPLLS